MLLRVETRADFVRELFAFKPDVVVADYNLPGFDGIEALAIVRAELPEMPFVIFSGSIGDERAVAILKQGANDYVLKDRMNRLPAAILRARQDALDRLERVRMGLQLEQTQRIDSLGRVAATVAHEFNNVLMMIQSAASALHREPANPAAVERVAERIGQAIQRGTRITQEVARFARPAEPALRPIDVNAWVRTLAEDARRILERELVLDLIVLSGAQILGDSEQLYQVLSNLVVNARDAIAGAGRITLTVDEIDQFVRFTVRDTGPGVPPDVLPRIFEPFFTTKRTGTGLGLAVSFQTIVAHGGQIYAESSEEGATFYVLLPRA